MPGLGNPKNSGRGANINSNWWRISSVNFNEDGTLRYDIDYWNDPADFAAGIPPLHSGQINKPANNGLLNAAEADIISDVDV